MFDDLDLQLHFTTRDIDERSEQLMVECRKFQADTKAATPAVDDRVAFESWMIQKLASLQLVVEMLNKRANLQGELIDSVLPRGEA